MLFLICSCDFRASFHALSLWRIVGPRRTVPTILAMSVYLRILLILAGSPVIEIRIRYPAGARAVVRMLVFERDVVRLGAIVPCPRWGRDIPNMRVTINTGTPLLQKLHVVDSVPHEYVISSCLKRKNSLVNNIWSLKN